MDPENLGPETETENQNPNPNPQDSNTENEVLTLLRQTVQETNARARAEESRRIQLEQQLEELRRTPAKEVTSDDFFANPAQVIRAEIDAQLSPLRAFVEQTKKDNAYGQLKAMFLNDAKYGPIVRKLGANLDNIMSNLVPNENNMFHAIHTLVGQLAVSNPEALLPEPPKEEIPREEKKPVIPPHLRPSAPPLPDKQEKKVKKNYTENERRLMRENNMNEEQWEEMLNAPASLKRGK